MKDKKILGLALGLLIILGVLQPAMAQTNDSKIQSLVQRGWVQGRDHGDLALDHTITRAEFTKMVVVAQGLEGQVPAYQDKKSSFTDVGLDHWANGYINLAVERGYITGYPNGDFSPNSNISYEEIIAILTRTHPLYEPRYNHRTGRWSQQYIDFGLFIGLFRGLDLDMDYLDQPATRGLAFVLIYNFDDSPKEDRSNVTGNQSLYEYMAKPGSVAPRMVQRLQDDIEKAQIELRVVQATGGSTQVVENMVETIKKEIESIPNDFYGGQDFLDKIKSSLYKDLEEVERQL